MAIVLRCVDIIVGREDIVGVGELRELVDPVLIREVLHPPVGTTAVVRHHIHDDLDTFLVCTAYHLAVEFVGAVARVDMVVVGACIAML